MHVKCETKRRISNPILKTNFNVSLKRLRYPHLRNLHWDQFWSLWSTRICMIPSCWCRSRCCISWGTGGTRPCLCTSNGPRWGRSLCRRYTGKSPGSCCTVRVDTLLDGRTHSRLKKYQHVNKNPPENDVGCEILLVFVEYRIAIL